MSAAVRIACSYPHTAPLDAQRSLAGGTALHAAAFAGNLDAVEHLLKHHRSDLLEALTAEGSTAVHLAARRGHVAVVKALIDAGCNTAATGAGSVPLLHHAVMSDDVDTFAAVTGSAALTEERLQVRSSFQPYHDISLVARVPCRLRC